MQKLSQAHLVRISGLLSCVFLGSCELAEDAMPLSEALNAPVSGNLAPSPMDDELVARTAADFDSISVLANDIDPDGDTLNLISATSSAGQTGINEDGSIYFEPPRNAPFDEATITYTVSDGTADATAVLTISVEVPVILTWQEPSFRADGSFLTSNELSGYEISYRRTDQTQFVSQVIEGADISTAEILVDSLADYEFRMASIDIDGLHSDYSPAISLSVVF